VKSHEEIEAELDALGWKITAGPSRTANGWTATMQRGWTATMQRGSSAVQMTGWTKLGLLEDMLRKAHARGTP
jgi:hypothetical protein